MSDRDEAVPELDADAKAFLARHQQTGEPSAEALERVRAKLVASAPAPEKKLASVTRLPARRPMLPPEVKAAAAVVGLLLGAQALYLLLREQPVEAHEEPAPKPPEVKVAQDTPKPVDAQLEAVTAAWRAGDFERARRLAAKECTSAACGELSGELAEMLDLATRVEQLSEADRGRLRTFDQKLVNGQDSALRRRLEKPSLPAALAEAKQLEAEAETERRAKNFEAALEKAEKCIQLVPQYHPCFRLLGSIRASIGTRDQSTSDMEEARRAYERFLELAPPDDEYVPKVTAILEAAAADDDESVSDGDVVRLAVGRQTLLSLDQSISRVALGDASIAEVQTRGEAQLKVTGLSAGRTSLLVWDGDNRRTSLVVEVAGPPQKRAAPEKVSFVPGGQTTLTLEADITRIAVGDPEVATVRVAGPRELRVEALTEGKTPLLVWFAAGGRKALELEVKPSNEPGDRLAKLFVRAAMAQSRGDYVAARVHLLEVMSLDPGNKGAELQLAQLRSRARDIYLRGYQLKETSPKEAVKLFREVVALTPPEDETHQKARARIAELTSGR